MIKLCIGYLENQDEPNHQSSVEVGKWLEEQYDLYSNFVKDKESIIAQLIERDTANFINNPRGIEQQIHTAGTSEIEYMFTEFLTSKEAESVAVEKSSKYPIPTGAAKAGKSSRFKSGYGPKDRPSFVDSGTIADTVKVWYEE